MGNEIVMIPIGELEHHPENPRKDLGDLTELTASIKANGILQNLTVVHLVREMTDDEWSELSRLYQECPTEELRQALNSREIIENERFWVVIGNRRFEAAKSAGLEELPCVVSDMDHKTQVATMLEENMQRQDLTVYEQAQGFQMMMELGYTQKEISEKTGFSETTVNRRLKMAELDKKTFKQAVALQITIDDLDKIGQIENVKERNELLKEFGDSNYDWKLNRALKLQKANKVRAKAHQMIEAAKIEKVPEKDKYAIYGGGYDKLYANTCELHKWDGKTNIIPKTDEGKLYYTEDDTDICFYVKKKKQKAAPERKSQEELEEQRQIDLAWKTAVRATAAAHELRKAYAEKSIKVVPSNAMEMLRWALIAAITMAYKYDTPTDTLRKDENFPVEGYNSDEIVDNIHRWFFSAPQSRWPGIILAMFEGDDAGKRGYVTGEKQRSPMHRQCKQLDLCYQWLNTFGYRMSDEEEQMQDGTHPVFTGKVEEQ